jgi:hypothetical protein
LCVCVRERACACACARACLCDKRNEQMRDFNDQLEKQRRSWEARHKFLQDEMEARACVCLMCACVSLPAASAVSFRSGGPVGAAGCECSARRCMGCRCGAGSPGADVGNR